MTVYESCLCRVSARIDYSILAQSDAQAAWGNPLVASLLKGTLDGVHRDEPIRIGVQLFLAHHLEVAALGLIQAHAIEAGMPTQVWGEPLVDELH